MTTKATDTINNFEDLALHAVDGIMLAARLLNSLADDPRMDEELAATAASAALMLTIGVEDICLKGAELSEEGVYDGKDITDLLTNLNPTETPFSQAIAAE
jgi:hypothetical protein